MWKQQPPDPFAQRSPSAASHHMDHDHMDAYRMTAAAALPRTNAAALVPDALANAQMLAKLLASPDGVPFVVYGAVAGDGVGEPS